jgi:DNA-binding transcriptional LysR family regulator
MFHGLSFVPVAPGHNRPIVVISFNDLLIIMGRLDDLRLFLRVLDSGSISAAARGLGLSAAVASQHLGRLERELGVRLLHRTTRKLRGTPEGLLLAERGRASVEELVALTSGLSRSTRDVTGTLRVSVSSSFGRQYISPVLPAFLAHNPRLELGIDFSDQERDLVSDGLDLAIRIGRLQDSNLVARRLAVDRRVLCAAPSYLERRGTPRAPDELAEHECLLLTGGPKPHGLWQLTDPAGRELGVRVRGRFETNLGEALRDAALAGLGIALHSTWHVCEDLRAGRLQLVLPEYPLAEGGIYAVTPRRQAPARVRAFIDFLVESFGARPPWERNVHPTHR